MATNFQSIPQTHYGATHVVVERAESLLAAVRLIVAEMYPEYDRLTREQMIAFAVAVAE